MADHIRTQIREAVVLEVTGLATAGTSVFDSRVWMFEDAELPALNVTTPADELDDGSEDAGLSQVRHCTVVIQGRVKASDDYAAVLDNLDKEITEALADATEVQVSSTLKSLTSTFVWIDWELENISDDQDKPVLVGLSTFKATYKVSAEDLESVA